MRVTITAEFKSLFVVNPPVVDIEIWSEDLYWAIHRFLIEYPELKIIDYNFN